MSLELNQKVRVIAIDESGKQNQIHCGYIVDMLNHIKTQNPAFAKVYNPRVGKKDVEDTRFDVESSSSEWYAINSKRCKVVAE